MAPPTQRGAPGFDGALGELFVRPGKALAVSAPRHGALSNQTAWPRIHDNFREDGHNRARLIDAHEMDRAFDPPCRTKFDPRVTEASVVGNAGLHTLCVEPVPTRSFPCIYSWMGATLPRWNFVSPSGRQHVDD